MRLLPDPVLDVAAAPTITTAGITGLGTALPATVVDNAPIAAGIGVDSEWIVRRTGIERRHSLLPGERLADLAALSGARALSDAGIEPADVDLLIVATVSQDEIMPSAAAYVSAILGTARAGVLDVGAACAGFVSALSLAAGYVESGRARTALVIGAESIRKWTDHGDKRTAALFGDGAGAAVLQAGAGGHIGPVVLGHDGTTLDLLTASRDEHLIRMDGHEVFKHAVKRLAESTEQAVAAAGLAIDDIDLFVYHQANRRILTSLVDRLDLNPDRVVDAIAHVGNTSAASVPLALAQARDAGRVAPGAKVLLAAIGAGLVWGATVVEWGNA